MFWLLVYDDLALQWKIHCRRASLELIIKEAKKLKGKAWEISVSITSYAKT